LSQNQNFIFSLSVVYLAMIGEETKWLDELDAKLAKGLLRASADAEELSEELDVSYHFCA